MIIDNSKLESCIVSVLNDGFNIDFIYNRHYMMNRVVERSAALYNKLYVVRDDVINCEERSFHYGLPIGTVRKVPLVLKPSEKAELLWQTRKVLKKYISTVELPDFLK